jgi:hypothetical protein
MGYCGTLEKLLGTTEFFSFHMTVGSSAAAKVIDS